MGLNEENFWRAVAEKSLHPTQLGILRRLRVEEELGREQTLSPVDFADATNSLLSFVSYHFAALRTKGLIEVAKTEPVRGAVKHYYRLVE